MQRLRIVLEFSKGNIDDLKLYSELSKFSNPAAHTKDILKGLSPLPTINDKHDH